MTILPTNKPGSVAAWLVVVALATPLMTVGAAPCFALPIALGALGACVLRRASLTDHQPSVAARPAPSAGRVDASRPLALMLLGVVGPMLCMLLITVLSESPALRVLLLGLAVPALAGALAAPLVYRLHAPRGLPPAQLTPLGLANRNGI
jgi:hypothetical protein